MKRMIVIVAFLASGFLFLQMDCQESLPPYKSPQQVFSLRTSVAFPDPHNVFLNLDQQVIMHEKLTFELDLVNIYEETLSGMGQAEMGEIVVWWDKDPNVQATISVRNTDEISGNFFNPIKQSSLYILFTSISFIFCKNNLPSLFFF